MIKLVKILSASNNIPTIEERTVIEDCDYYEGEVYYLTKYGISRHTLDSEKDPKFYLTEGKKRGDGKVSVKGFLATPDMIFETASKVSGNISTIEHLSIVPLGRESDEFGYSYIISREDDTGYSAQVYDASESLKNNYRIRLAW